MSIESDVLSDLIKGAIAAIGSTYPIQSPGRKFTAPNNGKYFELVVIQDLNGNESWGKEELFSGDIRIILHWPSDADAGIYEPVNVLGAIKAQFQKGARLGRLLITENPRIIDAVEGKNDMLFPLIVTYQYYHRPA